MTEIKANSKTIGQIQISDEVIATIVATAALEAENVIGLSNNAKGDISDILRKKTSTKGVKVAIEDGEVSAELQLTLKFGCKIQDVAAEVQDLVRNAVETMTGLSVKSVNVGVGGVLMPRSNRPKAKQ